MKQISQMQLTNHIELVKWEHQEIVKKFNLLTVHSLLIDSNPKFIELKQIIEQYNHETEATVGRVHLKQKFVEKLYGMLCELVRIPIYENMIEYLNNVYKWAQNDPSTNEDQSKNFGKNRPTTATTRTRPFSAYSRPFSGKTGRPGSAVPTVNTAKIKKQTEEQQIHEKMRRQKTNIDYDRLKHGEKQFYAGYRTLHEEVEHPKKRLKEYQRKIFYDEESESDVEILEVKIKQNVPQIPIAQQKFLQNQLQALGQEQGEEGRLQGEQQLGPDGLPIEQNAENAVEQGVADDIPLQGQEQAPAQAEEQVQTIDKLKPAVKAYLQMKDHTKEAEKQYYQGQQLYKQNRNYKERKVDEDLEFAQMQAKWAGQKSRIKTELKRRAESARMATKKIGIQVKKEKNQQPLDTNVIDFKQIEPVSVNNKGTRQIPEFTASIKKNRDELIKNAFLTGKLEMKIQSNPNVFATDRAKIVSLSNPADRPKKKTFEQILRDAEQKVKQQADEQILDVKQAFAKNKISYGANRIAKSITYYEKQLPQYEPFVGHITGMNMIKNPFIKVAKKKKKRKRNDLSFVYFYRKIWSIKMVTDNSLFPPISLVFDLNKPLLDLNSFDLIKIFFYFLCCLMNLELFLFQIHWRKLCLQRRMPWHSFQLILIAQNQNIYTELMRFLVGQALPLEYTQLLSNFHRIH